MTETPKTVFVTKWALTEGVLPMPPVGSAGGLMEIQNPWRPARLTLLRDCDWHTTREAAVSRANQMRDAKLTSLNKQVERLRGMRF